MKPAAYRLLVGFTLLLGLGLLLSVNDPWFTDAYYYYNAGEQLAQGEGLRDMALWVYVNAPDEVPTESHRYWMPLASIIFAVPMALLGTGFNVAQLAQVPFLMGLACQGMWLGWRLSANQRIAWVAGLSTALGGFYLPFWLSTDTFALFGCVGSGA
ncbi:MAG: hypothetical protein HC915_19905 [Anaerolineae bacterium]|nr:hypothetical protein [Anaerolineae bacterium]